MPRQPQARKSAWLLPTSIAICALMVLPGGTFLLAGMHAPGSGASPAHVAPGPYAGPAYSLTGGLGLPSWSSHSPTAPPLLSGLPAPASKTPWVQSLIQKGPARQPLTSLPNLRLLEHPPTSVAAAVVPGYVAQPAPLGLTDYGLGATPYSYNTSHLLGQVTFAAPPNVTEPGSTGIIEPAGAHLGYVGNVYEFGIQLNTVATNISFPGSDQGFFWTQNVVDWNDTGIHFVDDTFNVSNSSFYIEPGTVYSGCGANASGAQEILNVYGGVFQCVGGTIPVSPAAYPVTIQLYNNATVNAQNRTQVSYGYRIFEAGIGRTYAGVSDTVVFNNPTAPVSAPANTPGFTIDGFAPSPAGLLRDAEIDLVGDIGGDNAVFRAVNGSVNLEYSNLSSGGWKGVPSAYNFGSDTGETAMGIADYWTASGSLGTLHINQGPTMLYGLWNAIPSGSVASGSIHLAGSITPSYGFVFVSNTPPVADPWALGAPPGDMSWMPTTNAGKFNTYLPPLGVPWTTQYYVQGLASGSAETAGPPVTGTNTTYSLSLPLAPGNLNAPLYMLSDAQAAALAKNVSGSAAFPYVFSGLTVNINASFNHLNDYSFPSFELVMTQALTHPVYVNAMSQGQDSAAGNFYISDGAPYPPGATGFLYPGPAITSSFPGYTAQINVYNGIGDRVSNESLSSPNGQGGEVVLWEETGASVWDISSLFGSGGVWVGDSTSTKVWNVDAGFGAAGIQDIGSRHTHGWAISVLNALGVEALSSVAGSFSWINVTAGEGVSTGGDLGLGPIYGPYYNLPGTVGLSVTELNVSSGSVGANITLSTGTVLTDVTSTTGSVALQLDGTVNTAVNSLLANGAMGIIMWAATGTTITDYVLENGGPVGSVWDASSDTTVSGLTVSNYTIGVFAGHSGLGLDTTRFTNTRIDAVSGAGILLLHSNGTSFVNTVVNDSSRGILIGGSNVTSFSNTLIQQVNLGVGMLLANGTTFGTTSIVNANQGVWIVEANRTSFSDTSIFGANTGISMANVETTSFGNTSVNDAFWGVAISYAQQTSFSNLNVTNADTGVLMNNSNGITLTDVVGWNSVAFVLSSGSNVTGSHITGTDGIFGFAVVLENGTGARFTDVNGSEESGGVELIHYSSAMVTTIGASMNGAGLDIQQSTGVTASGITASGGAIFGVAAFQSNQVTIDGVTATGGSVGALIQLSQSVSVDTVTASNGSFGVGVISSAWTSITTVTVSNLSVGVFSENSMYTFVTGVTATNATLSSPWTPTGLPGNPALAAVVTEFDRFDSISDVTATTYPLAYYDMGSFHPSVDDLNGTGGAFAVYLSGTTDGTFVAIGAYQDGVGLEMIANATGNVVTGSSFVASTGYGVAVYSTGDLVYDNTFFYNNGATGTYNAAHVQAAGAAGTTWNLGETGNYWADWHTYTMSGILAPYFVIGGAWDYFPLGGPEGTVPVYFYESGLASGVSWSVTLGRATQSTANTWLVFYVLPGSYAFAAGAVAGYSVAPASGTVTASGAPVNETLSYTARFSVTVSEIGLPLGTNWNATVGGVTAAGTAATLALDLPAGTYNYAIGPEAGYTVTPPAGSITVGASGYHLSVAFAQVTYAVTISEGGLGSGASWSATVNGATQSTAGSSITFWMPNGTYSYSVGGAAGYTASPASGSVRVSDAAASLGVTFTAVPTIVTVMVTETGLQSGTSWSAIVDGVSGSSSSSTISINVPTGTYGYQIPAIAGYHASPATGSLTVSGPYTLSIAFSQVVYPVTVTEDGLATGTTWSATVNGMTQSSAGSTITYYLPNGSYSYRISNVSGYSLTGGSGTLTVSGAPGGAAGGFSPTSTPATVSTSTYNMGFAIAVALGAVALGIGVIALLLSRRPRSPAPAAAWNPPAGTSGGSQGTGAGDSGSASGTYWNEGAPSSPGDSKSR